MLTLQFVPYDEIENLETEERIKKLLGMVKEEKIVVLEGRLEKGEETQLIKRTMEEINERFKGIEISVVYPKNKRGGGLGKRLKNNLASALFGGRQGFTIIGPATLIREIKKDPDKVQLMTSEFKQRRRKA